MSSDAELTVWGLKNCDTCRKARAWLDGRGVAYAFKDVRADGLSAAAVERWLSAAGSDRLINRRGTTWRGLGDADKARADNPGSAVALLVESPSLIKRPVFELPGGPVVVGFGAAEQAVLEAHL